MMFKQSVTVVDSHTEGEPYRLVTGNVPKIVGKTMSEKLKYFKENYDDLRKGLMHEPRGHADMFGGILTEAVSETSDFGILFIEGAGYLNMCGHGTIATITIILETGLKEMEYPKTTVTLDTPAGTVVCTAQCENGQVKSVSFENVPSFLYKEDAKVVIDEKEYVVDIAFGGSFFALVNVEQLGVEINLDNLSVLKSFAKKMEREVNKQVEISHPWLEHITTVDLVEIYGKPDNDEADAKNVVIFGGSVDRSPCGTGTSAKLGTLYAKGKLRPNEVFRYASIIDSKFYGKIVAETNVGDFKAVVPEITGSAYITGFNTILWDENDPYYNGFQI
ncbi:MAG: proline racemase family protein [Lachnospirales bacterium]